MMRMREDMRKAEEWVQQSVVFYWQENFGALSMVIDSHDISRVWLYPIIR